jgi:hypothetical protein
VDAPSKICVGWDGIVSAVGRTSPMRVRDLLGSGMKYEAAETEIRLIEQEGYAPKPSYERIPLKRPVDWAMNPFKDGHWQYQLSALDIVLKYILFFDARSDDKHLGTALEYVIDWCRYHLRDKREHAFAWYNMSVGQRALRIAFVIEQTIRRNLPIDEQDRDLLAEAVGTHIADLSDEEKLSLGNHGLFQTHGLMALSRLLDDESERAVVHDLALQWMNRLVRYQYSDEGVHLEHSPGYHFFGRRMLDRIFATGWYGDNSYFAELLPKIKEADPWMTMPNGRRVTVGDTYPGGNTQKPLKGGIETGFAASPWPDARLRHFPRTGYSIARSTENAPAEKSWMLFLTGGFHSHVHKHSDDLSFEWFDKGRPILIDVGCYGYKQDKMRRYALCASAHNTVQLNGKNPPRQREFAYGSCLDEPVIHSWGLKMGGELFHPEPGFSHRREIALAPGRFLIVSDTLHSRDEGSFRQWWHFAPDIDVQEVDGRVVAGDGTMELEVWSLGGDEIELVRGQTEPHVQGWVCAGYLKMEPAWAMSMGFGARGQHRLTTVFCFPGEEGAAGNMARRMHGEH